jgi:membrane protease YdiL (CAAX protease family)
MLFIIGLVYNLFRAALPEEIFFRGFIQSRLISGFNSKWIGLVISSIFFGIGHTSGNLSWGYGSNFLDAFAESIFIQTAFGFLYGIIYLRTGSLIPGILLHAAGNSANSFIETAEKLQLL